MMARFSSTHPRANDHETLEERTMRILILGGDGYLGWATAMHFSSRGHEVHAIDNYLRRRAHRDVGSDSLTPIGDSLPDRAAAWKDVAGKEIGVTEGDLVDWESTAGVFRDFRPDAIVHYGEMPSAPYSMRDRDQRIGAGLLVGAAPEVVVDDVHLVAAIREPHRRGPPEVPVAAEDEDAHA